MTRTVTEQKKAIRELLFSLRLRGIFLVFFHGRFLYINFVDFLIYYSKKSALLTSAAEMLLFTPKMKFTSA